MSINQDKYDVVVIGGGPAGVTAALRSAELGATVALVERENLGGTCTNDGCVPTRVLARAARLVREAGHFEDYGLVGTLEGVDFPRLLALAQKTVYRVHEKKQLIAHLRAAGVSIRENAGSARFVDDHMVKLENGALIRGEKIILCAGGRARRLPVAGSELALTHTEFWSLRQLPRSIAIIGGAATGSQLASILHAFGVQVWLLESNARLLAREDQAVSEMLRTSFLERGIQVITGIQQIDRLEPADGGLLLRFQADGRPQALPVERALFATGWPGNADLLNLEAAGVQSERGYVLVDDYLRTTAEHIYAAGDINGRMMLVQSAGYEARIAAENALLGGGQRHNHQIVPHGGFTDPEYGSVGLTEEEARQKETNPVIARVEYADLDRAFIDGRTRGFCKLVISEETHRILGAHIMGEQALETVQLVAAAIASGMWVEQLAELELAYPTYTAILGLAARQAVHQLGVLPLAPSWSALGRAPAAEWERSLK